MLRQISADPVEVLGGMVRATTEERVHHLVSPDTGVVLQPFDDNDLIKSTEPDAERFPAVGGETWGSGELDKIEIAPEPAAMLQLSPDRSQGLPIGKGLGFSKSNDIVTSGEQETKVYKSFIHMFNLRTNAPQETEK